MGLWNKVKRGFKKITRGFTKLVKATVKGIGDLFVGAANFVGSLFGWNMAPDPGNVDINQQQGTTVTKQGGDHSIPLVFSQDEAKVGGHMVHMSTSGSDNKFLHVTYVLGYGEASTIVVKDHEKPGDVATAAVWGSGGSMSGPINYGSGLDYYTVAALNTPSGQGDVNYASSVGYYANNNHYGRFFLHNGGFETSASDNYNVDWHNDKKSYRGLIFVKMRLEWPGDLDPNSHRIPFTGLPNFDFAVNKVCGHRVIKGLDVHPVNILYDLLRNSTYGLGIDKIYIDDTTFVEMAGDSKTSNPFYGLEDSTVRFDMTQPVVANIKSLLYAMGCTLIWKDNKFYIKPCMQFADRGVASSSRMTTFNINTHTIEEADVIGGVAYETPPEDSKYKTYEVSSFDNIDTRSHITTTDTSLTWYKGLATYLQSRIDPNATAKKSESVVGYVNGRLEDVKLLESHYGSTVSLSLGAKHSNIEVYDIINVNYARANLSGAKYVVLDVEHTSLETVNVRAIRYLYDDDAEGISARDVIVKLPNTQPGSWLAVPTGYGLDSNTQVDQFLSNRRSPNELTNLKLETSPDFFVKKVAGDGSAIFINRIKASWTVTGDPNNTKYTVQFKKQGELKFDTLFDTNETETFIENLEDTTEYFIKVTPKNQSNFGVGRTNRITTLDSTTLQVVPLNHTFTVTDENGEGQAKKVAGATADLDTFVSSGNPYAATYTAGTYQPYGLGETSTEGTTVTDTYKTLLAQTGGTAGAHLSWNDYDFAQNGGAGTRTDGGVKIVTAPSDLRPQDYADAAAWNAAVGTWGGTKHVANEFGELQWTGWNATVLASSLSASNRGTTLTGVTVDTASTNDWWWEGRVELAPDGMLPLSQDSYAFGSGGSQYFQVANSDSMFVYMYSSGTNDAITTPVWASAGGSAGRLYSYKPGGAPNRLTGWDTSGGDPRVFDAGLGQFTCALAFDDKYNNVGGAIGSNAGRKWGRALPVNEGRYVTPILVSNQGTGAATYGIRNYDFKLKRQFYEYTFENIDTSTLTGSSASRTFTWTAPLYGRVKSVVISTNNASSVEVVGYLTADPVDNTQSISFKCVNTQNGNDADARVDITIRGFPEVAHVTEADTLGNIRAIEYKNNFDGSLSSV